VKSSNLQRTIDTFLQKLTYNNMQMEIKFNYSTYFRSANILWIRQHTLFIRVKCI